MQRFFSLMVLFIGLSFEVRLVDYRPVSAFILILYDAGGVEYHNALIYFVFYNFKFRGKVFFHFLYLIYRY